MFSKCVIKTFVLSISFYDKQDRTEFANIFRGYKSNRNTEYLKRELHSESFERQLNNVF